MRVKQVLSKAALSSLFVLLVTQYAEAASAVLGIDIGQEYIKAALVKPGIPLEIVLTKDTKRKEVSAIGFKPSNTPDKDGEFNFPERLYGADAINLAGRFPHDVYPNLKQLLGKLADDEEVSTYSTRYPALKISKSQEQGTVVFESKSSPGGVFTLEELLAMQLKAVVGQAQAMAGPGTGKIRDVMLTVPAFFSPEEKNALTQAAELAGLKVMGFVSDGLAVGINYATTRTFDEKNPEFHIIYDMGAGSTTASVLRFQGKSVKDVGRFNKTIQEVSVLGVGYDATLGGDLFNEKMAEMLANDFVKSKKGVAALAGKEDPKKALRTNPRASSKLWREATRARQILSANTETFASVESLYEDTDFRSGKLTRAEFEAAIAEYEPRITKPIFDALEAAQITLDKVSSIILHGGAVRTPFVGKKLEETVGGIEKISKNVNSDEAAVFGATFKGAGESGSFKVKEIRTNDNSPYAVSVKFLKSPTAKVAKTSEILPAGSAPGAEAAVTFPHKTDFDFDLGYHLATDSEPRPLAAIKATNVTISVQKLKEDYGCADPGISTKFNIEINKKDGIPATTAGWVECEIEVLETSEKKGIVDNMKKAFGFGKDKDSKDSSASADSSSSSSSASSESSSSTTSAAPEPTPTLVKKTMKIPLAFTTTHTGIPRLSATHKEAIIQEIKAFDTFDANRRAVEEARNELEAFTYKARELLYEDDFIAASTDAAREQLEGLIDEAGEWLYGDGYLAPLADVTAKLKDLTDIQKPILKRRAESKKRPELIKSFRDTIANGRTILAALKPQAKDELDQLEEAAKEAPKVEELYTAAEIAEFEKKYDEAEQWLDQQVAAQAKLQPYEDAVVSNAELEKKSKEVAKIAMDVLMKKVKVAEENLKKAAAEQKKKEKEEKERKQKEKKEKEQEKNKTDDSKPKIKDEL
ncbi:Hsp70 protein-domain-containing protein [Pyronema domesticum]|uniref:Similar to Heat shock protein 70 homolog acc. no. Q10061 n=1 Tax=Pyronema omphalodes (strain CBS 100304) TaxID=1076935 RepID=U4LVF2_PYROM|nr:Hsp70 protein-domain-containing protein [Pyronema domesticum]CCX32486.1 Similar to Heat shock protein 70 homolog; acc. no. Q10061 [Pyronema omphalodes CBS 100304]